MRAQRTIKFMRITDVDFDLMRRKRKKRILRERTSEKNTISLLRSRIFVIPTLVRNNTIL